jgi:hypothetical protein
LVQACGPQVAAHTRHVLDWLQARGSGWRFGLAMSGGGPFPQRDHLILAVPSRRMPSLDLVQPQTGIGEILAGRARI